ncbi:hypothetical protein ACN27F_16435 [Solwaraspora sp. WMMB335]|uniref:hypothetical protein n=1 Tax=Solwaraspora sp. WMMB335 TaxID=3404118 RepID=UPI003B95B902
MSSAIQLDYLIERIQEGGEDPLQRLATAVQVSGDLEACARKLVQQFVEQARGSGASWTQIGLTMSISKQAAQKRFSARDADNPRISNQGV